MKLSYGWGDDTATLPSLIGRQSAPPPVTQRDYPHGPKSGWEEQARQIVSGEIPTTEDDILMLLEWLEDINWPGARIIAQFLPSFGHALIEPMRPILRYTDDIWSYWILSSFSGSFDRDFWLPLKEELLELGYRRHDRDSRVEALYLMARHRLEPIPTLRQALEETRKSLGVEPDDYKRIEKLLPPGPDD